MRFMRASISGKSQEYLGTNKTPHSTSFKILTSEKHYLRRFYSAWQDSYSFNKQQTGLRGNVSGKSTQSIKHCIYGATYDGKISMKYAFIPHSSVSFFGWHILLPALLGLFGVREVRNSANRSDSCTSGSSSSRSWSIPSDERNLIKIWPVQLPRPRSGLSIIHPVHSASMMKIREPDGRVAPLNLYRGSAALNSTSQSSLLRSRPFITANINTSRLLILH